MYDPLNVIKNHRTKKYIEAHHHHLRPMLEQAVNKMVFEEVKEVFLSAYSHTSQLSGTKRTQTNDMGINKSF